MTDSSDTAQGLGAMPSSNSSAYAARSGLLTAFDRFASTVTRWCGSPVAFCLALATVALWAAVGPLFGFSENWQLVINTGTTIVTFLMVFLIQQSQNKDSVALHLKLNELLAAHKTASNRMIGIETLDEQDLQEVAAFYARLSERAKTAGPVKEVHSIDEDGMPVARPPSQATVTAAERSSSLAHLETP
ncbi:low affinity iron permease family protein [Roseateles sp. NT4]|uniref:low affinity iron permease family protein n=1 Tax=Roseateles sp. NT4 TaxID=3453715 RepID=UPI003EEFA087